MSYSIHSCDCGIVDQIEGDEAFVIWLYFGKNNFPTDCVILKVTLEFLAPIVHLWVTILRQFLDVEEPQGGELHNFIVIDDMILNTISGRMLCSGISHIAFASVYSEKTRLKKCWIIIIIIIITEKPFTSK